MNMNSQTKQEFKIYSTVLGPCFHYIIDGRSISGIHEKFLHQKNLSLDDWMKACKDATKTLIEQDLNKTPFSFNGDETKQMQTIADFQERMNPFLGIKK